MHLFKLFGKEAGGLSHMTREVRGQTEPCLSREVFLSRASPSIRVTHGIETRWLVDALISKSSIRANVPEH